MQKINKILICLSIMLIFTFVCMPDVFSASVKINGGQTEIYNGGSETATFDKTTNTLTLNGYNGDYIVLDGFDNQTVNVILKGENKISQAAEHVDSLCALGVDIATNEDNINLVIKGEENSKLTIEDYFMGIFIYKGNISIENANIYLKNIEAYGVFLCSGDLLSIKDTYVSSDTVAYTFANNSSDILADNLTLKAKNTDLFNFVTELKLTIRNSNIESDGVAIMAEATDTEINNSTLKVKNVGHKVLDSVGIVNIKDTDIDVDTNTYEGGTVIDGGNTGEIYLDNTNITAKDARIILTSVSGNIKNSKIVTNGKSIFSLVDFLEIEKSNISGNVDNLFMQGKEIKITDSFIDATSTSTALNVSAPLEINNSYVHLKSNEAALYLTLDSEIEFDDAIKLVNTKLLNKGLINGHTVITGYGVHVYAYANEELAPSYLYTDLNNIFALVSKELTFSAKYKLSFNANGGKGQMDDVLVKGNYKLPECMFTAPEGKKFVGWSLTADGKTITDLDINDNLTVYAIWKSVDESINPPTGDKYLSYVIISITSLMSLIGVSIYARKKLEK